MFVMVSEFDSRLLSTSMESDDKHRTTQGKYPGCGAIFMSNSATKTECFKNKLFGLPLEQGQFVRRVKKGMILFLFEFEKRELHGVFQACSDGAMDISSSAWTASGKTFPAQVRVKPIWRCHPLPESEFGDAIKENYFSKWKFNFGLSESQVWRLLRLFNLRKLTTSRPQRALSRDTAAKLVDTVENDGEFDISDKLGNMRKVDNELQVIIPRRYEGRLLGMVEKDDTMYGNGAYLDLHHGALPSTYNTKSGQFERGGNLEMCGSVSHSDGFLNSGMPLQETYRFDQDTKPFTHLIELPITGNSYAASHGDAIIEDVISYGSGTNLEDSRILGNFDSGPHYEGYNRIPSSYSLSPSNYPSFLVDHRYPAAIQTNPLYEIGAFTTEGTSLEEINCQLPRGSHSDRILRSDFRESRKSVFSRLGFSTPGWCQENLGHPGHEVNVNDTASVDEVMAMLHVSRGSWMKPNKSKLFKNIKQNSMMSKLEKVPDKSDSASASPTGDDGHQSSMSTLFLDFKRRNRKVDSDINRERTGGEGMKVGQRRKLIRPNFSDNEPSSFEDARSAEVSRKCEASRGKKRKLTESNSSGDSSAQCSGEAASGKRKKLARPSFGENDSALLSLAQCSVNTRLDVQASDDKFSLSENADIKKQVWSDCRENAVEILQRSPSECSSGEFAGKNYEPFVGSEGNVNVHTRSTTSEMEIKRESSGECQKFGDGSGNDHVGSQIVAAPRNQLESSQLKVSKNNAQEYGKDSALVGTVIPDAYKNSLLARLSDNFPKTDQLIMQESLTQPETNTGRSDGSSEIKVDTGRELEGLQMVKANKNCSNRADDSMVNNQLGVASEQLHASGNSHIHRLPQEDGSNSSKNNVVENVEFDLNKALNDALNENKKLRSIIRGRGLLFF